jgi:hypothetical protein
LSVNAVKTSMVLFTNKKKLVGVKKPILFGTELHLKNQVKFLGVILDEKLIWNSHIDHRMQKATIVSRQCRRAIGKTWGLKAKVVYWVYTSEVRPISTYAALLWWKKRAGSMKSTPTAALEVILMLPPLGIYIEEKATQATDRLNCSGLLEQDLAIQRFSKR